MQPISKGVDPPCSYNSLNAGLEFDDSHFGSFVQRYDRHIQHAWQTGQTIRLVLIVERVEYLDCSAAVLEGNVMNEQICLPRICLRGISSMVLSSVTDGVWACCEAPRSGVVPDGVDMATY